MQGNHPTHTTPQGGKGGNHQSPHPNHTTPQGGGKQPTTTPHHTTPQGKEGSNPQPHHTTGVGGGGEPLGGVGRGGGAGRTGIIYIDDYNCAIGNNAYTLTKIIAIRFLMYIDSISSTLLIHLLLKPPFCQSQSSIGQRPMRSRFSAGSAKAALDDQAHANCDTRGRKPQTQSPKPKTSQLQTQTLLTLSPKPFAKCGVVDSMF